MRLVALSSAAMPTRANREVSRMLFESLRIQALQAVNLIRMRLGESPLGDLPQGDQLDGSECPIARALPDEGLHICQYGIKPMLIDAGELLDACADLGSPIRPDLWDDEEHQIETPRVLGLFIRAFDTGHYPDLIAQS